ncbi:hypothetical protein KJ966_09160 [bacterium]|nr:hypothetical protein [bacterium]
MRPGKSSNLCPFDNNISQGNKIVRIIGWALVGVVVAVLIAFIFGWAVQFLWSLTLTPLFGFQMPTYWQAVGLIILARIIFGGFGHGKHSDKNHPWHRRTPKEESESSMQSWHDRLHGFDSCERGEDSLSIPDEQRKHYQNFWQTKGKEAFDDYLKNLEDK